MKTTALSLILAFTFWVAQAGNDYQITYHQTGSGNHALELSVTDFSVVQEAFGDEVFSVLEFSHQVTLTQPGYAALPYLHATVMIDAERNVRMVLEDLEYDEIQLSSGYVPSRGIIYRDTDPATIPYVTDPKSIVDEWYPRETAVLSSPFILRDIRGVNVYLHPFQYNAVTRTLRVLRKATVKLVGADTPPVNPLTVQPVHILREMDGIYRSVFINYDQGQGRDALTIGQAGDILVITTPRDETAIQPYIDWKREKGYLVEVQVVAPETNVNQLVQDAYDANNDLLYVQLVGDWADLKCNTMGTSPMDPQVGCVVGTDEYADIAVGRISANSPAEVTVQVDKIINYEKNPEAGGTWYSVATGIGSQEGAGIGDDGEIDFEHLDIINDNRLVPFGFDGYNPIYEPGATSAMVHTAVNAGTSIINYCGHGSATSWGTTGFSNGQVANLLNEDRLPFIVSVACNNGDFHTGTCFAEAWLRKEDGGAVAMLAASISQPWDPPMRGQDYFMDVLVGGYDYTLYPNQSGISTEEQRTTLGAMVFNGLTLMTTEATGPADWETAKTWNLFGDPSMQIRTATPAALTVSNTVVMTGVNFITTITVDGAPFEGAMVALTQAGLTWSGITDASGQVDIAHNLDSGDVLLVVTGFNTETLYDTYPVVPPSGPFVMFQNFDLNDAAGNNNGLLDYAEQSLMEVFLTNVGTEDATDVVVTLSTNDPWVTIIDSVESYGTIPAGATVSVPDGFEILAAEGIPDMHSILIDMSAESGTSDLVWTSSFVVNGHAPEFGFVEFVINDDTGNGNGKIDPGETVDITLTLTNAGSSEAFNVAGTLTSTSEFITVHTNVQSFGNVLPEALASQVFSVTADSDTPQGHPAAFMFYMTADHNLSDSAGFNSVVGQIPVLIIDFDKNNNSSAAMEACLANLGVGNDYYDAFPENLGLYSSVFVCLGVYPDNTVLTAEQGQILADYLNEGGNVYMEGADTWYYDQQWTPTPVHPMFAIEGLNDGGSDLSIIEGEAGTMCEDMVYNYTGENNYIDQIAPTGNGLQILTNTAPVYAAVVSNDGGTYKTIGSTLEFGGLQDGEFTKDDLMIDYLIFFGIDGVFTSVEEPVAGSGQSLATYPNPVSAEGTLVFELMNEGQVTIELLNLQGQVVTILENSTRKAGLNTLRFDAGKLPGGLYLVRMQTSNGQHTEKIIIQ